MRRRLPPPTKEPSGDRLDTNTFVSGNGTLASNGKSPLSTMRTPTKGQHSPHVSSSQLFRKFKSFLVLYHIKFRDNLLV